MSLPNWHASLASTLVSSYPDVLTPDAIDALNALAGFDEARSELMTARLQRRQARSQLGVRLTFMDPDQTIGGTSLTVRNARDAAFAGGDIPRDLTRQWIQGTGPAAKPRVPFEKSIRSVAYALLSGADGWMFDAEDALGQVTTMSLDNQRNLKLAIHYDERFLRIAEDVAGEMNQWSMAFLGRSIVDDWAKQLAFTTKIFRPRGLHLNDRHVRHVDGTPFSASIADIVLFVTNNHRHLRGAGSSLVLYLPKIQTAEEAAFWHDLLVTLERHLGLPVNLIKTYVLIEQLEACFQLMEIRSALRGRLVGFNTGRWDYINSVADAMAWDSGFVNPNIDAITMTYGYMRHYEDRVRRAANTPDANGRCVLWQGGMEPTIPVGTEGSVRRSLMRAVAGAERERAAGASGKWVAHWRMVHVLRPVWERHGADNQLGRRFAPLTYSQADADALFELEAAPRTLRGARDLLSVGLQYANAFAQGLQAAALKPADQFSDPDAMYLMEDMATGEIRLSVLWEWVHKGSRFVDDEESIAGADVFTPKLFIQLLAEEYQKLQEAAHVNVHEASKTTTLPIARAAVEAYVLNDQKLPWFIDVLNINLDVLDFEEAQQRISRFTVSSHSLSSWRCARHVTPQSEMATRSSQ